MPYEFSQELKAQIIAHEDIKQSAYQDSLGYWTIGIGKLIDARKGGKLSLDEINYIFNNSLQDAYNDLKNYSWFNKLDAVRQGVLIELDFNIGLPALLKFVMMIAALKNNDYAEAAEQLKHSLWANQVGPIRVNDMCYRLIYGAYQ
jgi:lysozyme